MDNLECSLGNLPTVFNHPKLKGDFFMKRQVFVSMLAVAILALSTTYASAGLFGRLASCNPCEPATCTPCEPVVCTPCEPVCDPCAPVCGPVFRPFKKFQYRLATFKARLISACTPCEPAACAPCEPITCAPCEPVCDPCAPVCYVPFKPFAKLRGFFASLCTPCGPAVCNPCEPACDPCAPCY